MANNRGGGPGTYMDRGVRCTMDAPFGGKGMTKAGIGGGQSMKAPFDRAADVGRNDIPTKKYAADLSAKPARTVNAGMTQGGTSSNPPVGTRRFKNPR